jgi:hypothetical protein
VNPDQARPAVSGLWFGGCGCWDIPVEGRLAGVDPVIVVAGYVGVVGLAIILAILWWQ